MSLLSFNPFNRTLKPAFILRATVSPIKFAIDPPLTKIPAVLESYPRISLSQSITKSSTAVYIADSEMETF